MKNASAKLKEKSKPPQRVGKDLRESMDLSQASVDRANSVIFKVKVLAKSSQNRHGMPGCDGTDYMPSAHAQARALYEGREVNVGHPPRNDPDAERAPSDRNGVLFNARDVGGETFADWQLIPSHPMTPTFLDCAENPRLHGQFAMSHNAKGFGTVREGRYQITEIPLVRSVDVVTRGGCNRTLFESKEPPMKKKFRDVIEAAEADVQLRFANLLEMDDMLGDMPVEAPMPAEGETKAGWMEHFGEMVKAIIADEAMDAGVKQDKIMAAMKACLEEKKPDDVAEGDEGDEDEEAVVPDKSNKMESKERDELARFRTEKKARDLCESLEFFDPTTIQIKAIAGLPTDTDRKALAKQFKEAKAPAKKGNQPRTATGRTLLESAVLNRKTDKKSFAESIVGN